MAGSGLITPGFTGGGIADGEPHCAECGKKLRDIQTRTPERFEALTLGVKLPDGTPIRLFWCCRNHLERMNNRCRGDMRIPKGN